MLKYIAIGVSLAMLGASSILVTGSGARSSQGINVSRLGASRDAACRWARSPRPPFDQRWRCV